ncbi:hypothetical protein [Dactylosporangium sp. NPDC048998]|uniref:hypothetical protein n=1 Tax=Dactylosporangium sp. NPDC048998 TaxID=3363976 RepID=UPI003710082F
MLRLPVRSRWVFPDPRIDAIRGCVAAERGPLVLCAESVDLPGRSLDDLRVDPSAEPDDTDNGTSARGVLRAYRDGALAYHREEPTPSAGEPVSITLVPYYQWARRGPSTMRVWLPQL